MKTFPKQRLSYKEKIANDYEWCKEVIDYLLLDYANDRSAINQYKSDYDRKLANYQLYNNQLNQADFERECNPLGLDVGQFRDAIQPYNKTYNKIQVLLGEELKRPFIYKAVLTNADGIKSKLAHKDMLLKQFVLAQIQNTIKSVNESFDKELVESQQVMSPQEINKFMSTEYLSAKEIVANKLLNYFYKKLSIPEIKNDSFKHGLISGEEFVYVGIVNGEPYLRLVNPLSVNFYKSQETKYVQDGMWASSRGYMTTGDVLDEFGSYLKQEDIDRLEEGYGGRLGKDKPRRDMTYKHEEFFLEDPFRNIEGSYSTSNNMSDWLVQHVEWKSQKKVGFLQFFNEYGEIQTDLVSEEFVVPEEAIKVKIPSDYGKETTYYQWQDMEGNQYTINWDWVPEVWSGVRIGEDIYCMMGPKEYQFRSLDNPYDVKLGYHGLVYNSMNADSVSLMDRMKPFQYLYFIVMHKLKKLIAQDNGRIFHFDTSMVDPKIGLDKTLYYLTNLNIDFFNPLQNTDQPGWTQRGKIHGSTDMSTGDHIMNYVNLLISIDQQISDVAGVTRPREGQATPNEAVTNAQTNIQMSSVITEIYFQAHIKLWEHVLNSFLQIVQACYSKRKVVKQFILDDMSQEILNIDEGDLNNADFGVFVSNSYKEEEVFQSLKGLAQALVQNDKATFSDMIKMLKATSVQELQREIEASEKNAQEMQMQMMQQQAELEANQKREEKEFELEKQARDHENRIALAYIDSMKFQRDQDIDDNGIPDQFEVQKFLADIDLKKRKLDLEEEKFKVESQQKDAEIAIKRRSKQK